MDLTLQLWKLLLIIVTCLIASGIISSFILKHLWTKNKDQIVKISDDSVSKEIVNLITELKVICSVGPIFPYSNDNRYYGH